MPVNKHVPPWSKQPSNRGFLSEEEIKEIDKKNREEKVRKRKKRKQGRK